MARPHRRALAFLGFWVRQLLAAHRKSARWSISLHYRIASLQGRIAVDWCGTCVPGGEPAASAVAPSVAALGPAGACDHRQHGVTGGGVRVERNPDVFYPLPTTVAAAGWSP